MKLKRAALLAMILALASGGCASKTRDLQARLDRASGELRAQQLQLQSLSLQSTNLEQRMKQLETASPGVGQMMMQAQFHFAKLYYAGEARNWDLAQFEFNELEEDLAAAIALRPTERGVNLSRIMDAFTNGPLTTLQNAIEVYDQPQFRKAYQESMEMCNTCHQATGRPYIVITVPTNPPVFNQRWEPSNVFGTTNENLHEH